MSLTFREDIHEYRWKGRVVPNVTTILQPLTKLWTNGNDLERARQEGQAIHCTVELFCNGELDVDNLPEWLWPYLHAWQKFVLTTGFVLTHSEHKAYSETYGYAGTCDLAGTLTKLKGSPEAVIDIKRTLGAKTVGPQLSAYEHLLPGKHRRFGLCLDPPRLIEYEDPRDWTDFLTCLAWYRLQERMKTHAKP